MVWAVGVGSQPGFSLVLDVDEHVIREAPAEGEARAPDLDLHGSPEGRRLHHLDVGAGGQPHVHDPLGGLPASSYEGDFTLLPRLQMAQLGTTLERLFLLMVTMPS